VVYRSRIVDGILDELFPHLAAVALEGAKGVGKTATASQRARTVLDLADPAQRTSAEADYNLVTALPPPVLIDEWQLVPPVWDRIRRAVDDDPTGGRFLLTGSAGVAPGIRIHSGAGRIVSVRMRPLTFVERAITRPEISLGALLAGDAPLIEGRTSVSLPDYADEILRSGFPGIRDLPEAPRRAQLDSYLVRIVDSDLVQSGAVIRRPAALRRWLTAYAAATSTTASYTTILDAASAGEADKPARQTVAVYRDHLERIFVLDPLPAWTPVFSPMANLTRASTHHLVDPALAARLVGVDRMGLLSGSGHRVGARADTRTWLGALFESLVTQSVRVYAESIDASVGHLRTRNGSHEVDLIVERPDHAVVGIEVKLSSDVGDADVRHLNWLQGQLGDRLVDRIVVNTGPFAYRRKDGVAVIPFALLGA